MVGSLLGLILAGCGGQPEPQAMPPDESGLKQFAELYRNHTARNKRPPKSLKELNVKGQGYPIAVEQLKSGELVVQWGAPLTPGGETTPSVLAYPRTATEQGGLVLLQDGRTIKKMSAEEFQAAPKAAGR
jgi:hypothetical protein